MHTHAHTCTHTHSHTLTHTHGVMQQGAEEDLVWSMKGRDGCLVPWQWNTDYFALKNRFLFFFFIPVLFLRQLRVVTESDERPL